MRTLLRIFFRLLYFEFAWTYDLVSWLVSIGQWRTWQRVGLDFLTPAAEGATALEVGHGPGHMLVALAQRGYRPIGLDLSPFMSGLAQRRLQRFGLPPVLLRGRVQALPLPDGQLDNIFSTFPTEYIVDPAALREFVRVLRPGGRLVAVPVASITGPAVYDRVADWLFRFTGQSQSTWFEPVLNRFAAAGLAARIERVNLARSLVVVIVADKAK
jgi:ubiquinone/menaquinone biosynthesis C-methylase UbiE